MGSHYSTTPMNSDHTVATMDSDHTTIGMSEIIINNQFCLDYKIGEGGYGEVYAGHVIDSGRQVAVKIQPAREPESANIQPEADICRALSGGPGIPEMLWCGQEGGYDVFVHERLGPSFWDLSQYCKQPFSLKTVLLIADQAIARLAFIHRRGYVHGDVKMDNFLMGEGKQGNVAYPIDFGMAQKFDPAGASKTLTHFVGTAMYAPLASHEMRQQSFGADFESLGYSLVHMVTGSLPWDKWSARDTTGDSTRVYNMKVAISSKALCRGLPEEFVKYMDHVRGLRYGQMPNYTYLRRLFRNLFYARGFKHDNVYDWTERLFGHYTSD